MRKKIFLAGFLSLLFSDFSASGQSCTVYYCDGCVRNGLCPVSRTFSNYDEAYKSGKLACPGVEPKIVCDGENHDGPVVKRNFKSPLGNGIMGGMLGGLGFSLLNDKNGKNQWMMGAAGGYFFFSSLTFIAEPKSKPMGKSIFLGAVNGAMGGAMTGQAIQYFKVQNSTPTTPAKEDKITVPATIGGAVIGGTIGALTAKKTIGGSISRLIRKSKLLSNTVFTFNGSRLGIVIRL